MSMAFGNGLPPAPWLQRTAEGVSHGFAVEVGQLIYVVGVCLISSTPTAFLCPKTSKQVKIMCKVQSSRRLLNLSPVHSSKPAIIASDSWICLLPHEPK